MRCSRGRPWRRGSPARRCLRVPEGGTGAAENAWPRAECVSGCSAPASGGARARLLRRLHRKMAVVDDRLAFVGGINIIDDRHHPGADGADIGRVTTSRGVRGSAGEPHRVRRERFVVDGVWRGRGRGTRRRATSSPRRCSGEHARRAAAAGQPAQRRTIEHATWTASKTRTGDLIASAYFIPGGSSSRRSARPRDAACGCGSCCRAVSSTGCSTTRSRRCTAARAGRRAAPRVHAELPARQGRGFRRGLVDRRSSNIDPYSLLLAREANVAVIDHARDAAARRTGARDRTRVGGCPRACAGAAVVVEAHRLPAGLRHVRLITFVAVRRVAE